MARLIPTAEVISIGDEMTSGARLDTNCQWLSGRLTELGFHVLYHTTVGDDLQACVDVFRTAAARTEVVVATGGLGPTQDDLTREALAQLVDQPLEFRGEAMAQIEQLFQLRGRSMPERNRVQAMFPVGSRILDNPQGTAPGIDLRVPRADGSAARLFALPGVPAEMRTMWQESVMPRLLESLGPGVPMRRQAVVKCFGLGESEMEQRLEGLTAREHRPRVGITVSQATISLRIDAEGESEVACEQQIAATRQWIARCAGEYVFGEGEEYELQHAVVDLLEQRGETLATLERGPAAWLAMWFSRLERPDIYRGGQIVPEADAGAGSVDREPIAGEVDWLLMVDAYPPILAAEATPLPAAQVRFTARRRGSPHTFTTQKLLGGHPEVLPARIAKAALDWFRKEVL